MSEAQEALALELAALLGMSAEPLRAALKRIVARGKDSPAACFKIELVLQGCQVVEIVEPPEKWRLLPRRRP